MAWVWWCGRLQLGDHVGQTPVLEIHHLFEEEILCAHDGAHEAKIPEQCLLVMIMAGRLAGIRRLARVEAVIDMFLGHCKRNFLVFGRGIAMGGGRIERRVRKCQANIV